MGRSGRREARDAIGGRMLSHCTATTIDTTTSESLELGRGRRTLTVLVASLGLALLLGGAATAIVLSNMTELVPWVLFAIVSLLGVLLVTLYARSLSDRSRLDELSRSMEQTARTDALTGLHNRRGLTEHITRATAHARRRDEPVSVLMIDLDRFKQTNERFGHESGDEVLCAVADCLRDVLRTDDVYGRWGADEFLVALPRTNQRQARFVAERLRTSAGEVRLGDIGLNDGVSLSVGVATGVHTHPDELVQAAGAALYRAKATGRVELEDTSQRLATPHPA
jgi:diguanylate cyclase (GGDEF)-like protein